MPYVSFCFTTYKRPDILISTVKSILIQSFQDFEIIISDNDPERSGQKVETVLNDARIKYFPNDVDLGMKKSFNKSLERSSGKYIVMIADDDPVYPDMLETLIGLEREYPGYGVYLGGGDLFCTEPLLASLFNLQVGTNTTLNNEYPTNHVWKLRPEEFVSGIFRYKLLQNYLWSCGIVKREILIEMGGVPDYGTPFLGDYAYLTIMTSHSGGVLINKALGHQSIHPENFGRRQNEQLITAVTGFREYVSQKFKKNNLPEQVYADMDRFVGMWVWVHLAFLFNYYKKHNLPLDELIKAEKEISKSPVAKKFYMKYYIKRHYPGLHDWLVKTKKSFKKR